MTDQFRKIQAVADLQALLQGQQDEPVALFLHDRWCPISAKAYRAMSKLAPAEIARTALIDVTAGHDLSDAIEQATGVRHESPQVIVLRGGTPVWHGSHFGITTAAVHTALSPVSGS